MNIAESRLTAQGQISVPARVRHKLGLAAGSTIEWQEDGDGVRVRRVGRHTFEDLHAKLFPKPPKTKSLAEIKRGLKTHIKARHARD